MKKSKSIKNESSSIKNKKTPPATPQKQSPNYMKSTTSFEARKEPSPKSPISTQTSTPASKGLKPNGSRASSLKKVRTLTKTPSFKPFRCSKKVIMCEEDVDAHKATCSSTLKDSKFPNYLQLNPGGTELDGTSSMKVCPYSYCSLNGHHHTPVPPLKSFVSARRRSLKAQKGFKLTCLSPREVKPGVEKTEVIEPVVENKDLFIDIYSKERGDDDDDLECFDVEWEEGYCLDSGLKLQEIDDRVVEDQIGMKKTSVETLYDEESVSSGAWFEEEDGGDSDSASDGLCDQMMINQSYLNYDAFEVSSGAESDVNDKSNEVPGLDHTKGDQNIDYQPEEESKTQPEFAEKSKDEADKNHTTIIYNIIQFNISVFVNGEKTEHTVQVPAAACDKTETEEAIGEESMSNEASKVNQVVSAHEEELPFNVQDIARIEQLNTTEKQDDTDQNANEDEVLIQSNSMELDAVSNVDETPAIGSDVVETHSADETTSDTDIKMKPFCKKIASNDEIPEPCLNLRGCKKPCEELGDDSREFNPRGPNFLPETPDPDAETVDLRHQMMDDRKNAEEWMVDFALQQAVTTLAPERKKKVALLVEAFEKVMPVPVPRYETHSTHNSKAFTNSRPMQACS